MKNAFFKELLLKKLTRREFLLHIGILLLAISGISGLIKIIADPNIGSTRKVTTGFGAGPYGGVKQG